MLLIQLRTPLFVGFPGFVSKLWIAHNSNGYYRGLDEWDSAALAEDYVRALWWVLALVSARAPFPTGFCRDFAATSTWPIPARVDPAVTSGRGWWRLTGTENLSP